jgi:hypothetical protein
MPRLEVFKLPVQIVVCLRLSRNHDNLSIPVNLKPANLQSCGFRRLHGKSQISLAKRATDARHENSPKIMVKTPNKKRNTSNTDI